MVLTVSYVHGGSKLAPSTFTLCRTAQIGSRNEASGNCALNSITRHRPPFPFDDLSNYSLVNASLNKQDLFSLDSHLGFHSSRLCFHVSSCSLRSVCWSSPKLGGVAQSLTTLEIASALITQPAKTQASRRLREGLAAGLVLTMLLIFGPVSPRIRRLPIPSPTTSTTPNPTSLALETTSPDTAPFLAPSPPAAGPANTTLISHQAITDSSTSNSTSNPTSSSSLNPTSPNTPIPEAAPPQLSLSDKIAIGVGLGIGIPTIAIGLLAWYCPRPCPAPAVFEKHNMSTLVGMAVFFPGSVLYELCQQLTLSLQGSEWRSLLVTGIVVSGEQIMFYQV